MTIIFSTIGRSQTNDAQSDRSISYKFSIANIFGQFYRIMQRLQAQRKPARYQTPQQQPKLKLEANRPHRTTLDIDRKLMNDALNRSYTKNLASTQKVDVDDVLDNVASFLMGFISEEDTQQQLEEFWCIVALNQQAMTAQESTLCTGSSTAFDGNPNHLQLYQLFIGLGKRQLRFQSLSNYKKFYILNMDTVQTVLAHSDVNEPRSSNHIRVIAENKHDFDFYFTPHTLPFRAREIYTQQQCDRICSDIAKHTYQIIRTSVEQSKGRIYGLKSLELPDQNFLEHRYATEQQFTKYCQTGDIILFRDNHTFAKIQRFFTNSECDHIGMIFRDEKYGICIFQSNSGTGVSLAMWNQLIRYKWYENIEGIYWRRLNMQNKPADFEEKVKEFIKVNLHKEYGISLGKLLRFKEVELDPEEEKNRTYFCSELIAALYKYLDLLEPGKPSSTYLPKDFTDKGSLDMINNTALEAERRLIFNQKILKESYRFYR